ncbi:DUF2059 domain-containing protein [Thermomonas brevis]|uniref:DUF2059 domain-containing protein n=1 Tax=Thermomonas brevis TaxID=215691 RepID=A0A7G9QQB2_9GAMM|nr:DUF2059 domain-containing protein [Thermomonas brevis]QNN45537.1 DUF2059 domain-containing protein [Thermomonas brevis]
MRRIGLSLALLFAFAPAIAAEPPAQAAAAQAAAESASAADVDRLLQAMDMKAMMAGMMQQMGAAQEKMLADAFGNDLTEDKRKQMQEAMAASNAIIQKHLSWDALEPIVRKVYAQVFSKREVQAMTAFYASPEGASILKKAPQAMALTMQEIQPVMLSAMQEVKTAIEQQAAGAK